MGQKVNPTGLRLGINKGWDSNWYAEKNYADFLIQDLKIKKYLKKELAHAGISRIEIGRAAENLKVIIHSARPGIIIGRKGEEAERIKESLKKLVKQDLVVNIKEIKRPEVDAKLVADNIVRQLVKRIAYRRAIRRSLQNTMKFNVGGCKIMVSGRLNGAEMARAEWVRDGRVPLHTLKADIDYANAKAHTIYGVIGVKVWIYKGDVTSLEDAAKNKKRTRRAK